MTDLIFNTYKHIIINETSTIVDALKMMDNEGKKLLIVVNDSNQFTSLVSIGDIQRSLIKNQDYTIKIFEIVRDKIAFVKTNESMADVKAMMLEKRAEFMPVLNNENELEKIIFWADLFEEKYSNHKGSLEIPVVIMAGGKGTRLKPITNIVPKPLIPLGEKTIAELIIDKFVSCGVVDFYFSLNYKAEMIKNYFNELPNKNYKTHYFQEEKPLGTAGSLSLLKGKIDTPFFVSNCDIIVNQNYEEVYKYHKENKNELTLIGALKNYTIPYGTLNVSNNGLLTEIIEKPEKNLVVNAGMYILEPHLLQEIPENTFFHITELIEKIIKRGGRVGVFPVSEASWFDVGNWTEYNKTLKKIGETPIL